MSNLTYMDICKAVTLSGNSADNDTKAKNKVSYEFTAIRKNNKIWVLSITANFNGKNFANTQNINNLTLTKKLEQISKIMSYVIRLRDGYIDDLGDIVYTSDEKIITIGDYKNVRPIS